MEIRRWWRGLRPRPGDAEAAPPRGCWRTTSLKQPRNAGGVSSRKTGKKSNSPRISSKIDEERKKGEKFMDESFSEEKERDEKVMNGKLKSPQRCGTDCRSLLPSYRHSPSPSPLSVCPAATPPGSPIHPFRVNCRGIVLLSVLRAIEE